MRAGTEREIVDPCMEDDPGQLAIGIYRDGELIKIEYITNPQITFCKVFNNIHDDLVARPLPRTQ